MVYTVVLVVRDAKWREKYCVCGLMGGGSGGLKIMQVDPSEQGF